MPIPSSVIPSKPRVSRKRPATVTTPAPPALALVAAVYSEVDLTITLTFDRAIDYTGFDGTQISVFDPVDNNQQYLGTGGVSFMAADTIEVQLVSTGAYAGDFIHLDVTAATGIIATDGGAWAGVMDLVLPFP
ncbi:MAG: hypothetical protein H7144_01435 [Burkholderiales bacterium]|nr:hypothetical protein [Phycisphaerae bacterium]